MARDDDLTPRPPAPERRRSGLGAARTYRPRGHTVREQPARGGGDQFRPALQLVDGSEAPPARTRNTAGRRQPQRRPEQQTTTASPRRTGSPRPASKSTGAKKKPAGKGTGAKKRPARKGRSAPPRPPRLAGPRRRLRLATLVALSLFAALGVRLVELQLTEGPAYASSGLAARLQTVVLPAPRGTIYDRNDAVLAHSTEARFVFADPELVTDPRSNAEALQPLLGIPASQLAERMQPRLRDSGTPSRFEWLARGVDIETAEAIRALNLPGIGIDRDERRHVPGNDLAANLIGFTGDELTGLAGLEAHLDHILQGVDGRRTFETGQGERFNRAIPGGYEVETPAKPGSHVRLTIDADLQYEVQRLLAEAARPVDAEFASAVVLDTRTFEVLAQASYPGYNAADPTSATEQEWADVATTTVFDPGSAHKPLVFAAALEEGVIDADDTMVVDPTIRKGDEVFRDTAWHPPGTEMTLPAIMAFSSNVGTIRIADELGPDALFAYQQAFGLGAQTGAGMPGEAAGGLLPPPQWSGSSYGSVPIGHSVDTTVLQLAAAYGVIANNGVWHRPSLVQAVLGPDGSESPLIEPAQRQVISAQTAAQVREIMEAVVTVPNATGTQAAIEGYRVAGKTGTGQLVVDGQYAPGNVSSFVGMAPAESPRFVVAVTVYTQDASAGTVTAPAFREMMSAALKYYRVPPSATDAPTFELYG